MNDDFKKFICDCYVEYVPFHSPRLIYSMLPLVLNFFDEWIIDESRADKAIKYNFEWMQHLNNGSMSKNIDLFSPKQVNVIGK